MTDDTVLLDGGSPQSQALQWLIDDVAFSACSVTPARVIQRYALAAFYYSAGGERWNFCSERLGACPPPNQRFLSDASECDWYGITCDANGEVTKVEMTPCKYAAVHSDLLIHTDCTETNQ